MSCKNQRLQTTTKISHVTLDTTKKRRREIVKKNWKDLFTPKISMVGIGWVNWIEENSKLN